MKKKNNKVLFKLFFIVLLLFFLKNGMYWLNTIIYGDDVHDLLQYMFLVILEGVCSIIIYKNRRLIHLRGIHLISFLWFVLMQFVLMYNGAALSIFLKCSLWPLLFETTYIYSLIHFDSETKWFKYYCIIAFIGVYIFLDSMLFISFGGASNMVYFVILTGPFLLLTKKKKLLYLILVCISVFAILSSKRSMILALTIFWMIQGFIYAIKYRKIVSTTIAGLLLGIVAIFAFQYIEERTDGSMSSRMDKEDVTNGREAIYMETWMMILRTTPDHYLLGNGHNAVKRDTYRGISAHNEWLEILYDYGIIALFLYLCLWIYMVRKWFYLYKTESKYLIGYTLCLSVWGIMSITSQLILYVSYILYLFMYIAFVEARITLYKFNYENTNYSQRVSNPQ